MGAGTEYYKTKKDRSLYIPQFLLSLTNGSAIEKMILSVIFNIGRTGDFFASNKYIADYVVTSEATVKRAIRKFKEMGFIITKQIDGKRHIKINHNHINKFRQERAKFGGGHKSNKVTQNEPSQGSNHNKIEGQNEPLLKRANKNEIKISDVINLNFKNQSPIHVLLIEIYGTNDFGDQNELINEFATCLEDIDQIEVFNSQMRFLLKVLKMKKCKPPGISDLLGAKKNNFTDGLWQTENWKNEFTTLYYKSIT